MEGVVECFRIDEGGYSGFDLLDRNQPFQGAAAVAISDEDAARLVRTHFPNLQATELKYGAIARRPANHPRILSLMQDVLTQNKSVTYVCDKRYLLILMFIDYAVEPFYYARGINFYEDGRNYTLGCLLYYGGAQFFGEREFDALLTAFQRAVKQKTPVALNDLVRTAQSLPWRQLPEALGPLAQACPDCLSAIATPGVSTDAAFVVLQALITRMEQLAAGPYRAEHDRSKNLEQYHALLKGYIAHKEEVSFRQSAIASLQFPLKLKEIIQVDSKSSAAVQIADVMVGAAIAMVGALSGQARNKSVGPEHLLPLYGEDKIIHLLPNRDIEAEREFRKGTQASEVIDYIAANFGDALRSQQ